MIGFLWVLVAALGIAGCGGGNNVDDTDTNSDTNTNTGGDSDTVSDTDTGIDTSEVPGDWVLIEPGSFWMGSPDGNCPPDYPGGTGCGSELGRGENEDLHYVTLTRSFEILSTEVLQGHYKEVLGWNPSHYLNGLDCPVERISWFNALVYVNELSKIAGLSPCFTLSDIGCLDGTAMGDDPLGCENDEHSGIIEAKVTLNVGNVYDCEGYRLPTEAEWEYAARAGSITAFYPSEGNDGNITSYENDPNLNQIAWYAFNDSGTTHSAGEKEANAWGLCDMSGNVAEWIWDWYLESYKNGDIENPVVDPVVGPDDLSSDGPERHVFRGGGVHFDSPFCRSAWRDGIGVSHTPVFLGLRPVRSIHTSP